MEDSSAWYAGLRLPPALIVFHRLSVSAGSPGERWFAYLTEDLLQRSDHRSVQALEADIRAWVKAWNDNPKPFVWTKSAEDILERLGRLLHRINGAGH